MLLKLQITIRVAKSKEKMLQQPFGYVQTVENLLDSTNPRWAGNSPHLSSLCQHVGGQSALLLRSEVKTSFPTCTFKKAGSS